MTLTLEAGRVARLLKRLRRRVVFAESCTAGLVSAQLAATPGISEFHCGSLVTYRNRSKQDWLSVPATLLEDPGPVSELVAGLMAKGALSRTIEADLAVAVTGHLGPHAPKGLDGLVFVGVAIRREGSAEPELHVTEHHLRTATRYQRQREAAHLVFRQLHETLESFG